MERIVGADANEVVQCPDDSSLVRWSDWNRWLWYCVLQSADGEEAMKCVECEKDRPDNWFQTAARNITTKCSSCNGPMCAACIDWRKGRKQMCRKCKFSDGLSDIVKGLKS